MDNILKQYEDKINGSFLRKMAKFWFRFIQVRERYVTKQQTAFFTPVQAASV